MRQGGGQRKAGVIKGPTMHVVFQPNLVLAPSALSENTDTLRTDCGKCTGVVRDHMALIAFDHQRMFY
jgi:hypothetical protein